jgi:phage baseplate assembly protein W
MPIKLDKSKSFRFELVRTSTPSQIIEHFNLIYPPESYSIKEAPRHSIMKLFDEEDNVYIDDFGDDNKIIKLRGSTQSPEEISGWQDSSISRWGGQEAMLEFRKKIINWRKDKKRRKEFIVKLYNLFDEETYFVYITNFEMEKNTNKPLFYMYNIDMFQVPFVSKTKLSLIQNAIRKIRDAIDRIESSVVELETLLRNNDVANVVRDIIDFSEATLEESRRLQNIIIEAGAIAPRTIADNLQAITDVANNFVTMYDEWIDFFKGGKDADIWSGWVREGKRAEKEWRKIQYYEKYYQFTRQEIGMKRNITFNEYLKEKKQDSKDNIPKQEYKNARGKSLQEISKSMRSSTGINLTGPDIANINDLDKMEVETEKIFVPLEETTIVDLSNQVITPDKAGDILGHDIQLSETGGFIPSSAGDLKTIDDIENMKQVVNNILSTELDAFVKLDNYGFDAKHTVGQAGIESAISLLKTKYIEALEKDPRIISVENVIVTVNKGQVSINSDIILLIGNFNSTYNL